jgi:hypothetical protein
MWSRKTISVGPKHILYFLSYSIFAFFSIGLSDIGLKKTSVCPALLVSFCLLFDVSFYLLFPSVSYFLLSLISLYLLFPSISFFLLSLVFLRVFFLFPRLFLCSSFFSENYLTIFFYKSFAISIKHFGKPSRL